MGFSQNKLHCACMFIGMKEHVFTSFWCNSEALCIYLVGFFSRIKSLSICVSSWYFSIMALLMESYKYIYKYTVNELSFHVTSSYILWYMSDKAV